jgi:hypothetical protein
VRYKLLVSMQFLDFYIGLKRHFVDSSLSKGPQEEESRYGRLDSFSMACSLIISAPSLALRASKRLQLALPAILKMHGRYIRSGLLVQRCAILHTSNVARVLMQLGQG